MFFFWVFFCVCVMYSGEYDACDVTLRLSVYPHRASLKKYLATVGIEPTYDFWMILFKLAWFGYTLRSTSHALYA